MEEQVTRGQLIHEALEQLANETWARREVPGEIERYQEIRLLTMEQLADDVQQSEPDRIGRQWVGHYEPMSYVENDQVIVHGSDYGTELWPSRTEDQLNLAAAIQARLDGMSGEDRLLVRWYFEDGQSLREIADTLHVSHMTVKRRLAGIRQQLGTAIEADLPAEEGAE